VLGALAHRGNEVEGAEMLIRSSTGHNAIGLLEWVRELTRRAIAREETSV
jgi:hypothetical protein